MKAFGRLFTITSVLTSVVSARGATMSSCRPTCIAFRLDRSAVNCHRSGAFSFLPTPWDLEEFDAFPCFESTTIFNRGAKVLPANLTIMIEESGKTEEVTSSRFDLHGTSVVTYCSAYTCPESECATTEQMGSTLKVDFFSLGSTDGPPIMSLKLGLTIDFAGGDPIGSFGSTRFGPLVPLWIDDPLGCRTRTAAPSLRPSAIQSNAPSIPLPSVSPSYIPSFISSELPSSIPSAQPSFIQPSDLPSTLLSSELPTSTMWPSLLTTSAPYNIFPSENPTEVSTVAPSMPPSIHTFSAMPSSSPKFARSEEPSISPITSVPSQPPSAELPIIQVMPASGLSTAVPSPVPTVDGSTQPSAQPSAQPTVSLPSKLPLNEITPTPSSKPSMIPSVQPFQTISPTETSSGLPTSGPSIESGIPGRSILTPSNTPSSAPSKLTSLVESILTTSPTENVSNLPTSSPSIESGFTGLLIPTSGRAFISTSQAPSPFPTVPRFMVDGLRGNAPTDKRQTYSGKSFLVLIVGLVAFLATMAAVMKHVVHKRQEREFIARFMSDDDSEDEEGEDGAGGHVRRAFARIDRDHPPSDSSGTSMSSISPNSTRGRRIGIMPVYSLGKKSIEGASPGEKPRSIILANGVDVVTPPSASIKSPSRYRCVPQQSLRAIPGERSGAIFSANGVDTLSTKSASFNSPSVYRCVPQQSSRATEWHSPLVEDNASTSDKDDTSVASTNSSPPLSVGDAYSDSTASPQGRHGLSKLDLSSLQVGTTAQWTTPPTEFERQLASLPQLKSQSLFPSQSPRVPLRPPAARFQSRRSKLVKDVLSDSFSQYPDVLDDSSDVSNVTQPSFPGRMTWSTFLNPLMETTAFDLEVDDFPEDMGIYGSLLDQNVGPDSYSDTSLSYDSSSAIVSAEKKASDGRHVFDDVDLKSDEENDYVSGDFSAQGQQVAQGKYTAANLRRWLFPGSSKKKSWVPVHSHYYGK